jgi:hypothetical protein
LRASELNEQIVIDEVVQRLAAKFPALPADTVSAVVSCTYSLFDGRPVRDFVPMFVERRAGTEISKLSLIPHGQESAIQRRNQPVHIPALGLQRAQIAA